MNENQLTPAQEQDKRDLIDTAKGLLNGENSRIGNGWFAILVILAALADLITLIPFVGDFVAPVFWVGVAIFLWRKGCGFLNVGRLATELIAFVAKLIPVIQEFPETTVGVILIVLLIRFEDRTGLKLAGAISEGGVESLTSQNGGPFNQNGRRLPSGRRGGPVNRDGVRQPGTAAYQDDADDEGEDEEADTPEEGEEEEQPGSFSYTDTGSSPTEKASYEFGEPVRQTTRTSDQPTNDDVSNSTHGSSGLEDTSSGSFIPTTNQGGSISEWHQQQNEAVLRGIESGAGGVAKGVGETAAGAGKAAAGAGEAIAAAL